MSPEKGEGIETSEQARTVKHEAIVHRVKERHYIRRDAPPPRSRRHGVVATLSNSYREVRF
jgi:hypothetical protein